MIIASRRANVCSRHVQCIRQVQPSRVQPSSRARVRVQPSRAAVTCSRHVQPSRAAGLPPHPPHHPRGVSPLLSHLDVTVGDAESLLWRTPP
eukprot:4125183-Prymnesium_polylepis.1